MADDPERRVANEFFREIGGQQASVPIKPFGARRLEFTTPHPSPRKPKHRTAVTLVAAALAAEMLLEAGASLPRVFSIEGRHYVIENGVARDMLKSGMITVEVGAARPENEQFVVTQFGLVSVLNCLGRDRLIDLGVLDPN